MSHYNKLLLTTLFCTVFFNMADYSYAQNQDDLSSRQAEAILEETQKYGFRDNSYSNNTQRFDDPFNYSASPMETNGFLISPNLTLMQVYNDNLRATENDAVSDFATVLAGRLRITKQIGRHSVSTDLTADTTQFYDVRDESTQNFGAAFRGQLEAKRGINIPFEIKYYQGFQERTNQRIESVTKEPVAFKETHAKLGFVYEPRRFKFSTFGQYTQRRLENNTVLNTNLEAIREDRDFDSFSLDAKLSYETARNWEPFIHARYTINDYLRNQHDGTGFNGNSRDNDRMALSAGILLDYKTILQTSFNAGYENRQYRDADIQDSDGLVFNAQLEFVPTQKTKWDIRARHRNVDDNLIAAGFDETRFFLGVEHELQHDLFGRARVDYTHSDFTSTEREDDFLEFQTGIQYIMSPSIQIGAEYLFKTRDSTRTGFSFDQNQIMLRLRSGL